ncbi:MULTISPECIES: CoA transferase [Solibacillus]|uniref:CoA transferase n=1 Tax=Solibacillus sp. NPDC093137 TaxID=3390678 RepID=UPI00203FAF75|nr:CoA transferase [Solibacillus isronensis]MCM3724044.1 CoA transferase [Solibacillus isronensis]
MKPLQGIRVLDMTTNISGPTLTMILADLVAEVIKVEKLSGDEARKMEPKFQPVIFHEDICCFYEFH